MKSWLSALYSLCLIVTGGMILIVSIFFTGCQFDKNPFLGTWRADLASFGSDPGDYWAITFYDDSTFSEESQIYSVPYLPRSGYYEYTETVLMLNFKGESDPEVVRYVIYDDVMVWEGWIYFYRQ